jgi:hypothetical protein
MGLIITSETVPDTSERDWILTSETVPDTSEMGPDISEKWPDTYQREGI